MALFPKAGTVARLVLEFAQQSAAPIHENDACGQLRLQASQPKHIRVQFRRMLDSGWLVPHEKGGYVLSRAAARELAGQPAVEQEDDEPRQIAGPRITLPFRPLNLSRLRAETPRGEPIRKVRFYSTARSAA